MAEGSTQAACKWNFVFSAQPPEDTSAGERLSVGVQPANSASTPREATFASPSFDLGAIVMDTAQHSTGRLPSGGRTGSGAARRRSSPWTAGKPSPVSHRGWRGATSPTPAYIQESAPWSLAPEAAFSTAPAANCGKAAAVTPAPPTAMATRPPTQPVVEVLVASTETATTSAGATTASPLNNVPPGGRHGAQSPLLARAQGHGPPPQPSGWPLPVDADRGDSQDAFAELIGLLLMPDEGEDGAEAAAAAATAPTGAVGSTGSSAGAPGFGSSQRVAFEGGGEGGARAGADRGGIGGLFDFDALAAALDEVDAALGREWIRGPPPELLLPFGLEGEGEGGPHQDMEGPVLSDPDGAALGEGQQGWRRGRRVMRRRAPTAASATRGGVIGSGTGTGEGAAPGAGGGGDSTAAGHAGALLHTAQGTGSGEADTSWQVLVSAPTPHNPEALATLLIAGRLVNPQTAVPAPLLAAVAQQQQQQQMTATTGQQKRRGVGDGDGDEPVVVVGDGGAAGVGIGGRDGHSQGPAVALVRCRTEDDVAAALALHSRRVCCPPLTPGGPGSWQPLTVVLKAVPRGGPLKAPSLPCATSASPSPGQHARVRYVGPTSRKLLLTGLPGHLDGDDLIAMFGTGVQLPGHCPRPQDRRFLLVSRDATSFDALMAWSGTRLPYKPLDALRQIVPRVVDWTTLRVEEDDGIQLPALMSELLAATRLPTDGPSSAQAAAAAARHPSQQQQLPLRPPRVAGRFHPAELDAMDEIEDAAPPVEGGCAGGARDGGEGPARGLASSSSSAAAAPASSSVATTAGPGGGGGGGCGGGSAGAPTFTTPRIRGPRQDVDDVAAAAAVAERAESSRGASSSGLAARPAPRPRRGGGGGGGKYASSVGAAGSGGFFGVGGPTGGSGAAAAAAAGCSCCPGPPSGVGGFGVGGGAASSAILEGGPMKWSGQAAMDLLNSLLALGIDPGLSEGGAGGQEEEDERAPFFRPSRKRMPVHFGRRPEDEDEEEDGEEGRVEEGVGADSGTGATAPAAVATAAAEAESADGGGAESGQGGQGSTGSGELAPATPGAASSPATAALNWRNILDGELL